MSVHAEALIPFTYDRGSCPLQHARSCLFCFLLPLGCFLMSLSWLRGRSSLFLIRWPTLFPCVVCPPCTCLLLKRDPVSALPPSRSVPGVTAESRLVSGEWRQSYGLQPCSGPGVGDYGVTVNFHTKTLYLYLVTIPLTCLNIKALPVTCKTSAFQFYPTETHLSSPKLVVSAELFTILTPGSSSDFSCSVIFFPSPNAVVSLCLSEAKQKEILT